MAVFIFSLIQLFSSSESLKNCCRWKESSRAVRRAWARWCRAFLRLSSCKRAQAGGQRLLLTACLPDPGWGDTYGVPARGHVLLGVVAVLDQLGSKLIQGLQGGGGRETRLKAGPANTELQTCTARRALQLTVIFSSWALRDFSKSSCFFSRASTLSRESPRSSFSRNAWRRHAGVSPAVCVQPERGAASPHLLLAHPVVHLLGVPVEELQVHALLVLLPPHLPQAQQRLLLLREDPQLLTEGQRDNQHPAAPPTGQPGRGPTFSWTSSEA